jgi:pectin lyase
MVLAEGNVFQNVVTPLLENLGQVFTSPDSTTNAKCTTYLGHACQINAFGSSGAFSSAQTDFFTNFSGKSIATAAAATTVASSVTANAGIGKI